jgi:hypothetical protein
LHQAWTSCVRAASCRVVHLPLSARVFAYDIQKRRRRHDGARGFKGSHYGANEGKHELKVIDDKFQIINVPIDAEPGDLYHLQPLQQAGPQAPPRLYGEKEDEDAKQQVWTWSAGMTTTKLILTANGTVTYKPRRLTRHQHAQAHNSTPNSRRPNFM